MIYHNMNIYCLMVHAQQVEERRVSMNSREAHWAKSFDDGSLTGKLDIQEKPRFKKRFYNQDTSNFPKARDHMVSNTKNGRGTSTPSKKANLWNVRKEALW